jgi:hypothetical protein
LKIRFSLRLTESGRHIHSSGMSLTNFTLLNHE